MSEQLTETKHNAEQKSQYISVSERLKNFKPGTIRTVKHYPTGIRKLDTVLGGGLYAGLTFLGARPGMGKSTFALQIASQIASANYPVLFYSLEMPSIRMESKILNRAIHLKYPDSDITSDWLLREEALSSKNRKKWDIVEQIETDISEQYNCLYIKERNKVAFSARDIIQDTEQFIREKKQRPILFVDYLQILSSCSDSRTMTERQKNDENINALSALSNKYGLAVFIISSLNRESYRDEQRPLRMDSFKETGSIEYSASVILGMQPRNIRHPGFNYEVEMSKDARELELVFLKQRYGASGMQANVSLDFYAAKDLYLESNASNNTGNGTSATVTADSISSDKKVTADSTSFVTKSTANVKSVTPVKKTTTVHKAAPVYQTPSTHSADQATEQSALQYPDDPRARLIAEFRRQQKEH